MRLGTLRRVIQSSLDSPEAWIYLFFNEENLIQICRKPPLFGSGQLTLVSGILHNYFPDFL